MGLMKFFYTAKQKPANALAVRIKTKIKKRRAVVKFDGVERVEFAHLEAAEAERAGVQEDFFDLLEKSP